MEFTKEEDNYIVFLFNNYNNKLITKREAENLFADNFRKVAFLTLSRRQKVLVDEQQEARTETAGFVRTFSSMSITNIENHEVAANDTTAVEVATGTTDDNRMKRNISFANESTEKRRRRCLTLRGDAGRINNK